MDADCAIKNKIRSCRICEARFAETITMHEPNPVVWFSASARILVAGQAPGVRVHESGKPFTDATGDRLRDWMGLDDAEFYDTRHIAILPMAFCFPGHDGKKSDLPPPPVCKRTWHDQVMNILGNVELKVLVGGYAQKYHLGVKTGVNQTVSDWREYAPTVYPLPLPSWRSAAWVKKNPWFEEELLPSLRSRVQALMSKLD
jgi:uracil-DNA glycosylase